MPEKRNYTGSAENLLSGLIGKSAAKKLLQRFRTLDGIGREPDQWHEVTGLSEAKARALRSAFSLASALAAEEFVPGTPITSTGDIARLMREKFRFLKTEELHILFLDASNRLIANQKVTSGSVTAPGISAQQIFRPALNLYAAGIALAHNHPSGDHAPSTADIRFTDEIRATSESLRIKFHDHVVFGRPMAPKYKDYSSFRELGLLLPVTGRI